VHQLPLTSTRLFCLVTARPRNDLLCVGWDVKPYWRTHLLTESMHLTLSTSGEVTVR